MRFRLVLIAAVVLLLPGMLFAKGGVYIDNVTVTNDGRVVFADNFDSGMLGSWTGLVGATVPCDAKQTYCSMHLNMHTDSGTATAVHTVPIDNPGVIEVSWQQWVAPASQQSRHNETFLALLVALECQQDNHWIAASTGLSVDADMPKLSVTVDNAKKNSAVSVPTSRWAQITLRIDPGTGTVSVLLDKNVAVSDKYDPSVFRAIRQLRFECGLGDGAQRTH